MRPSHDPSLVDEVDIALVHALQIAPRASWAVVGRALGVDPGTAARRWQRLVEHGLAWVTCYPADRHMEDMGSAYIEVDCAPGHVSDVGEQLTRRSHVVTVEHVSGEHNLLLTILAPGLVDLSHYLMHGLGVLPGVRRTRGHVATGLFREASNWQLHALDAAQQQVLRPPPADRDAAQPLTRVDT